jgi:hypothetical protein
MFSCSPSGLARPDAASQGRRLFEAKELLDRLVHFDLDPASSLFTRIHIGRHLCLVLHYFIAHEHDQDLFVYM